MGFRSTVVAGVLSTLIAAFISWLLGFWPTVWSWLSAAMASFWSAVTYTVPVPAGILAPVVIVLIYPLALVLFRARESTALATTEHSLAQAEQAPLVLSENELKVVRLLAAVDGQWIGLSDIASQIRLSQLLTEQALEKLFARGFLRDSHNYLHGTSFRLSSEGRDYAIEQGLVR